MTTIELPDVCLVGLVGVSGSGKSTFAAEHFRPTQVVSSDACRARVSDDENDQTANADAFELLHYTAAMRLKRFRFTVVDATNVQAGARQQLVSLAREHDVLPVAIVLDLPLDVCTERTAARDDRHVPPHALRRQHRDLRKALRSLEREGFRHVTVLRSADEVAAARVSYTRLWSDRTELTGPFDVIGDVHGCRGELEALLGALAYEVTRDDTGRAVGAHHPEGRTAVFVGDLVDRGPDVAGVLRLAMGMVRDGDALAVPGNHEEKLIRALRGRKVRTSHGLAETLAALDEEPDDFRSDVLDFCAGLVSHLVLDGGRLVVAHAGLKEAYHGRTSRRVRAFCLYGDTTGETDAYGLPVRYPWAEEYRGAATVLYGHVPTTEAVWVNDTMCLDTGCVFGGKLTALRWPGRELVSVPAERVWYEPAKPLSAPLSSPSGTAVVAPGAARSEPDVLDLTDVLGDPASTAGSGVDTAYHGRVAVRPPNAAAALEVMSRFAIDPHLLLYLPPTMAPAATSQRDGLLEHPAEAFEAYASEGVTDLVAEEKHMGSRAVLLVGRSEYVLAQRFGAPDGVGGAAYTRTGRSFFAAGLTSDLVRRLRSAVTAAGVWDELGADWLLLDAEILPWSVKAEGLLRSQYAPVGASGRATLAAATDVLAATAGRGIDVEALLARNRSRAADVDAYTAAYGRYVWDTTGLDGVQVAPFQLLASGTAAGEGATYHERPHAWHLALGARLAAADPGLVRETASYAVDTTSQASVDGATAWWEALTAAGGEGMVVKPAANLVPGPGGRPVQPGVKCRGRDYLRVVYGPEYTEPDNLRRLRDRGLGHKRSLALREYALGLEALDRVARGEPLWRVHQCVFAVLALESEPVDPRL